MKQVCVICHKEFEGWGNNPFPYYIGQGQCCDACNVRHVIPARSADIHRLIHSNPQIRPYA